MKINILGIASAVISGIVAAKEQYEIMQMEKKHFSFSPAVMHASPVIRATDLDNLDKELMEPISISGVPDVIQCFHPVILFDTMYTVLADSEKIAISEPLLRIIVDIASKYDDFDERSIGALSEVKHNLHEFDHFSKVLKKKRELGEHY